MEKINVILLRILIGTVFVCLLTTGVVLCIHGCSQRRQSRRLVIYLQAKRLAAEEQQQRELAYQKRLQEQRLRREFNQGRVVRKQSAQ